MKSCSIDSGFTSSSCGIMQAFCLCTGGGVFGILAQTRMWSQTAGHALLWISVSAWVITLLGYMSRASGKRCFDENATNAFNCLFSVFYIVGTICFGIFETWGRGNVGGRNSDGLLVFILALLTTIGYSLYAIYAIYACCTSDKSGKDNKTSVSVENGKTEEPQSEQKKIEE
uniref:Uncharacterized LOC100179987 n=1 Tax=Ciona intestinalis TaxID=7719 RepID=F6TTA3_CIOIN|nr:uncharacterized protein LOC100179987 isoform X2 [Ciona intestinalis]|eukprot:XP_002130344.1 uncharacterized protein LOC100179987 isoform X2 [Ciona intestinalis]